MAGIRKPISPSATSARARPRSLLARIAARAPRRMSPISAAVPAIPPLFSPRAGHARTSTASTIRPPCSRRRATTPTRAHWILADVASWAPDAPYDLIYSNATFQWVKGHAALLPRLVAFLAPHGVPLSRCHAISTSPVTRSRRKSRLSRAGRRSSRARPTGGTCSNRKITIIFLSPSQMRSISGKRAIVQALEGDDAVYRWVLGTGLRPYRMRSKSEERETFLANTVPRAAHAYPPRASGVTLFPFQRLFCVATQNQKSEALPLSVCSFGRCSRSVIM